MTNIQIKLSRAKSVINDKNSLRLSYSPLKVSSKSLTKFKSHKNKELLSKFEKEPPFTFSTMDSIQQLEERTKAFNNSLRRFI